MASLVGVSARPCDECGNPYVAKRTNSRYCGDTCRQRAKRGGRSGATSTADADAPEEHFGLVVAVTEELEVAGRASSALGQQALLLARRIAMTNDTGSSTAALSKELRAVLSDAVAGAVKAGDSVDEMKARRDAKRDRAQAG